MNLPIQTVLPFSRKDGALNRQIRERAEGKKVRPGLGRPKKKRTKDSRMSHVVRESFGEKTAVHVTVKVSHKVPNLRARRRFNVIKRSFVRFCGSGGELDAAPQGFRLIHFVVLGNHLHFVVEADHKNALSRGMQKLLHSISRRLNALSVEENGGRISTKGGEYSALPGWLGRVFKDRYHAHVLRSPTEMTRAVEYVLKNAEHHFGQPRVYGPTKDTPRTKEYKMHHWDSFTSLDVRNLEQEGRKSTLVSKPRSFLLKRACARVEQATHSGNTRA